METTDAYEILGVPRGATQEQIRRAYLRLSRQVHSDTGGSDGLFRQVKWTYDTLRTPRRRLDSIRLTSKRLRGLTRTTRTYLPIKLKRLVSHHRH